MEELNMTNVENVEENNEELEPIEVFEEDAGNGIAGLVVLIGAIGTAVVALITNKKKIADKMDQRRVKKLEKKGYSIVPPADKDDEWVDISDDANEN